MTIATVITAVRDMVQDEPWEDYLGGSYTAAATTVTVSNYTGWEHGSTMDFAEDGTYEQFRVKATPSSSTVSIKFAHNGTTNANHSNGATVLKDPRYGTQQIVNAITHIVNTRLYPDIWVETTATITPSPTTTNIYDLDAAFVKFLSLVQTATGSIEDLVYTTQVEVLNDVPTAISANGKALRVLQWPRTDVNATLSYQAKVTTSNMTSDMEPVIALGTAAYLLRTEAAQKADRFDEDDRPRRMLSVARALEEQFADEKQRLRAALLQSSVPTRRFLK